MQGAIEAIAEDLGGEVDLAEEPGRPPEVAEVLQGVQAIAPVAIDDVERLTVDGGRCLVGALALDRTHRTRKDYFLRYLIDLDVIPARPRINIYESKARVLGHPAPFSCVFGEMDVPENPPGQQESTNEDTDRIQPANADQDAPAMAAEPHRTCYPGEYQQQEVEGGARVVQLGEEDVAPSSGSGAAQVFDMYANGEDKFNLALKDVFLDGRVATEGMGCLLSISSLSVWMLSNTLSTGLLPLLSSGGAK